MSEMAWYIPVLIFFARICDVSIGTVRTILMISGRPWISAGLGFVEVIIWVLAVGGTITYLSNPFALLGYATGFATGVLVGVLLESRLALGHRIVRAISIDPKKDLSGLLRSKGFIVTRVDGHGRNGPVEIAFMVIKRRQLHVLTAAIAEADPSAFVTIGQADRPTAATLGGSGTWMTRTRNLGTLLRK